MTDERSMLFPQVFQFELVNNLSDFLLFVGVFSSCTYGVLPTHCNYSRQRDADMNESNYVMCVAWFGIIQSTATLAMHPHNPWELRS